mmetsp:Transcript_8319/g.19158  ORF Transcript_8319/g.19158 Transcript_8319/m.19158 type:complete len:87 (-) Transcript_8319:1132-1392(-)
MPIALNEPSPPDSCDENHDHTPFGKDLLRSANPASTPSTALERVCEADGANARVVHATHRNQVGRLCGEVPKETPPRLRAERYQKQ